MYCAEAETVCRYLKSKEIQLTPNNTWLVSCISYYKSNLGLANIYGPLQEYVNIQWLLADLQDIQQGCLPTNCNDGVKELSGKYPVQINWIRDIGQSCYSQLKSESIEPVDDDGEFKKQSWEPKLKRTLMMEVTDGIRTLKAMEYSPIQKLAEPFLPGCKVLLIGPIECRQGILFLTNNNVTLLGGEVDYLYEVNSKEKLLSRCLSITPEADTIPDRETNTVVNNSNHTPSVVQNIQSPELNEQQELPDSTSLIDHSNVGDRDMLMSDEDDDFLRQLPAEVLDCPHNISELSPVLNERCFVNTVSSRGAASHGSESGLQRSPVLSGNPLGISKPKLFPSLEDLRLVGKETTSSSTIKRPPIGSQMKALPSKAQNLLHTLNDKNNPSSNPLLGVPSTSASTNFLKARNPSETKIKPDMCIDESFGSSASSHISSLRERENNTFKSNAREKEETLITNNEDPMDISVNNNISGYPQVKRVYVKVDTITKLKIRNSEWQCCATVLVEDQPLNVTFSDKVLEKLFGLCATEVEIWREEMATNPSLKKKVNDILKAGQSKLKMLNCPMVLEYSSEDCIPHVVTVDIEHDK